jgi:hypothetical protein
LALYVEGIWLQQHLVLGPNADFPIALLVRAVLDWIAGRLWKVTKHLNV